MKLLVTGGSGLVGSRLCTHLRRLGHEPVSLSRASGTDLLQPRSLEVAVASHPDAAALVHLAAFTNVSQAWEQRGDPSGLCYRLNVEGTQNVVSACERTRLPLVHVSTDFVFNGTKPRPYDEDDPPRPLEWYGETKALAERIVMDSRLVWSIARISFPYGGDTPSRPDLVRTIASRLRTGEPCHLFTDQVITPTLLDDIAAGLAALALRPPGPSLFHLTGSTSLSPWELGLAVARRLACPEELVRPSLLRDYLKRDPRPRQSRLALANRRWIEFAAAHGLTPPRTVENGLDTALAA